MIRPENGRKQAAADWQNHAVAEEAVPSPYPAGSSAAQTSTSQGEHGSIRAVSSNVSDVLHDIVELSELQAQLLMHDSKMVVRRAVFPLVAIVAGFCLAQGAIPVLLASIARWIDAETDMSLIGALAVTSVGAVLLAAVMVAVGWWRVRHSLDEMDRTRKELAQNISWIKYTLRRHRG